MVLQNTYGYIYITMYENFEGKHLTKKLLLRPFEMSRMISPTKKNHRNLIFNRQDLNLADLTIVKISVFDFVQIRSKFKFNSFDFEKVEENDRTNTRVLKDSIFFLSLVHRTKK